MEANPKRLLTCSRCNWSTLTATHIATCPECGSDVRILSSKKSPTAKILSADFPDKLRFLFEPKRYKIMHGGRGAAKSWGVARALLILAAQKPLRVLCTREIQNSIADSVHKLLSDQVTALGLSGHFRVMEKAIRGINGSEFIFAGLRHNIDSIRSKEGIDIVWVEEANTVSKSSWEKLGPTIRKDKSEIWITFNPELESDETYQRFVVNPPADAIVERLNWRDNPWFPDVLRVEKDTLEARDPDAYLTVWEGHCRQALEGAIYANEIRQATSDGRIDRVPYDASKPVNTYWDLGRADITAIWFAQTIGFEHRLIDYYWNTGHLLPHYLKELQSRPYVYGTHYMPHDASANVMVSDKTIKQQAEAVYPNRVEIVPKIGIPNGINMARTIFPRCYFDRDKCADGLQALRHYQYQVDPETGQRSPRPWHNWASHGSDAFRYFAVVIVEPRAKPEPRRQRSAGSWMGA